MYLTQVPDISQHLFIPTLLYSGIWKQLPSIQNFWNFFLELLYFFKHFTALVYPYSNTLSFHFPIENSRANVFFVGKKSMRKLVKDKFHKFLKQSPEI